jgi:hypothetical protein
MIGKIVPFRDGREKGVDELGLLQRKENLLARPDDADQKENADRGENCKGDEETLKEAEPDHAEEGGEYS